MNANGISRYLVGILVIDEIQHLSEAKGGGSDKMLNFFVTLVNTIGLSEAEKLSTPFVIASICTIA